MKTVSLKIKKLSDKAVTPRYAKSGDAGLDLVATSMTETDMYIEYGTDLSMEIPLGYVGHIYPRSSLSNYDLILSNHVGVIDSGFRGEIRFRFKRTKFPKVYSPQLYAVDKETTVDEAKLYKVGDKIGQLILEEIPLVIIEEVTELEDSERGFGGFGSSGK
jgi:dUTP pyrophosphatase